MHYVCFCFINCTVYWEMFQMRVTLYRCNIIRHTASEIYRDQAHWNLWQRIAVLHVFRTVSDRYATYIQMIFQFVPHFVHELSMCQSYGINSPIIETLEGPLAWEVWVHFVFHKFSKAKIHLCEVRWSGRLWNVAATTYLSSRKSFLHVRLMLGWSHQGKLDVQVM